MKRAFLSHNSFDKDFVEAVFLELGSGKCVYDKETFKKNSDLASQIRDGLEGCEIYVLFLSQMAIESRWVTAEIDVAAELRAQWKVKTVLIFQLDGTSWDKLPAWMSRYVVSCPPSPHHVALRILDEIKNNDEVDIEVCYGRGEEERDIVDQLENSETLPSYIYLSGPNGIGRKTLANSIFRSYYPGINNNKILVKVDLTDDIVDIYRKCLAYSANWRASDLKFEMDKIVRLSTINRAKVLAQLLHDISANFNQVVILDLGTSALTEEGNAQPWFFDLTKNLKSNGYPYVLFLSTRFFSGGSLENGIFFGVEPLDEKWSTHLFRILIKKYAILLPSKDEQRLIESSIVGHPGLINMVANYLRRNPNYKPNRTHNNIVRLVNEQVQFILADFIGGNVEKEKAVAFIAETRILSYEEIRLISSGWNYFEEATEALLDAGLLVRDGGDYTLATYIQRHASSLAAKHREELAEPRRILLAAFDDIGEDSFVSIQLLDARIIEHIVDGKPIGGYLSNLVMPVQQIKAAKRRYDAQDYKRSLSLAKEAYEQTEKLSLNGKREAWRLIGLSAIRDGKREEFKYFCDEYKKIKKHPRTDAIFHFGNGLRERLQGNLREALNSYKKIKEDRYADSHLYRELAYIHAFEREFTEAYSCVKKAYDLAIGNPYILDIQAMILTDRYRFERKQSLISDLDQCLEDLKDADQRDGTNFYFTRLKIRDLIVNNDLKSLNDLYAERRNLPISARVALLSMLSLKDKDYQYNELHGELKKALRDKKNALAQIELARIDFEHLTLKKQFEEAAEILNENKFKFTELCCLDMSRQLPSRK